MTAGRLNETKARLLSAEDPHPVEVLNPDSDFPILLICEHAGQAVPERLDGLGISQHDLDAHVGWDIGAGSVARHMAELLGAPVVLQRYSRLVIDCNRPPDSPGAIPEVSDGVQVPGNRALGADGWQARVDEVFRPFHDTANALFDARLRRATFAIHSFTPVLGGVARPWDLGFLFRRDTRTSAILRDYLQARCPNLTIGMNEPYQIEDASDWFVPRHGEARGLPHSLIEIRNDKISDAAGQLAWAELLSDAITQFLKDN
jgi:predicted N-formylglutamate amidohydrolase